MLWRVLFALALTASANASGYDAYVRGITAMRAEKTEMGIEAFSAALSAGDLAEVYVPLAHIKRGTLYLDVGKCREGLADADAAVALKPKDPDAILLKATANACLDDRAAAEAGFAEVLTLRPRPGTYSLVGQYQWNWGNFAAAGGNFAMAQKSLSKDDSHKIYVVLWFAMSAARAGAFDAKALSEMAKNVDDDDWPWPVLKFYLGKTDPDAVYRAAADDDAVLAMQQTCEADFYLGEWQLAKGDAAGALTQIRNAAEKCPKTFIERGMAQTELERLGGMQDKTAAGTNASQAKADGK